MTHAASEVAGDDGQRLTIEAIVVNHLDHLAYERWLAEFFGIGMSALAMLYSIRRQPGRTLSEIHQSLGISKQPTTPMIRQFEDRGLITPQRPADRRDDLRPHAGGRRVA